MNKHTLITKKEIILLIGAFLAISFRGNAENTGDKFTVSGYIKDKTNGEELIGASVYIPATKTGTTSNTYGFHALRT